MNTKFVIISHGRTGSTVLCHALNENPQVLCGYELFGSAPQASPGAQVDLYESGDGYSYLNDFYNRFPEKTVGFKMFTFHGRRTTEERGSWRFFIENPSIKCVFLGRRNLINSYFSEKLAASTGNWAERRAESLSDEKIWVDPLEARNYAYAIFAEMCWAKTFFCKHDSFSLDYEDLQEDFVGSVNRVEDFLGVNRHSTSLAFEASLGFRAEQIVGNYDEVIECLDGTIFGTMNR